MKNITLFLSLFASSTFAAGLDRNCQRNVPCQLGDRSYHVRVPGGWDGESRMPVLIHFHGWQRTGALPVKHRRISGATRRRGVLLIAPNGHHKTWNFWSPETDDVEFTAEVIADVAARYPIDEANIFLSGYSYGSIMAWRVLATGAPHCRSAPCWAFQERLISKKTACKCRKRYVASMV